MERKKVEAASSRLKNTRQDAASTCYPELLRSYRRSGWKPLPLFRWIPTEHFKAGIET